MDSTVTDSTESTAHTSEPQHSILTLNNDILLLLCTTLAIEQEDIVSRPLISDPSPLKQLSSTCKRLRTLARPLIFRNVKLGGYGWTWSDTHLAITRMRNSQAVQRHTRRLSVYLSPGSATTERQNDFPDKAMFSDFVDLLQSIAKLQRLDLSGVIVPEQQLDLMKAGMSGLTCESVAALSMPCALHWMVGKFPNLQKLDVQAYNGMSQSPVEAIRQVPGIQHLECKAHWTPELLNEVYQRAPGLKTLAMQSSRPRYSKPVFDFVPELAKFDNLRCLVLAPVSYLNIGFSAPRCGNAYRGPNGHKVRERVKQDRERLSGLVAEAIFGKCKELEELWIAAGTADCKATCVRGEDGAVKEIQWSMGQWLEPAGRV